MRPSSGAKRAAESARQARASRSPRAEGAQYLADLGRGGIRLCADVRFVHHRHDSAETSDLYAAAYVQQRDYPTALRLGVGLGIGSAVVDFIFSIAKRDVTFFSGTDAISLL